MRGLANKRTTIFDTEWKVRSLCQVGVSCLHKSTITLCTVSEWETYLAERSSNVREWFLWATQHGNSCVHHTSREKRRAFSWARDKATGSIVSELPASVVTQTGKTFEVSGWGESASGNLWEHL